MASYYCRQTKKIVSCGEPHDDALQFLYKTAIGRIILKTTVARPWFNKLTGCYYNSRLSQTKIAPFVSVNKVNLHGQSIADYKSFGEFFIRENPKLTVDKDDDSLIAIADSKLSYYKINADTTINIKNSTYSVADLIGSKTMARHFTGGTCLVFRLSMNDNHRYIYCDNGTTVLSKKIDGELHTVRPISEKYNIYSRNARTYHVLDMDRLGRVIWIEVGAILVGKMHNHKKSRFAKGEEKGYFELGGSTIVLLIKNDIIIDDDIAQMNEQGIETQVRAGERIGAICSKD